MTGGVGAFGKMPGMGDFLRLNLPAGVVQVWDTWLQAALVTARQSLGGGWDACYMSAPIWRFSLPATADLPALSGIIMPSVDRVGRQYPLTLAAPCAGIPALRHFANAGFFDQLEDIALTALDTDMGRDALAERLAGVTLTVPPSGPIDHAAYRGALPPEVALAARALPQDAGIWTSCLDGEHRMFTSHGLPGPAAVLGMFDPAAALWHRQDVAVNA